ncbi:MAG: YHS domain-containing protein [Euryarchaeota archaeon]|nr:YHS domain-containing protein [Euryarchaeota archaeon]
MAKDPVCGMSVDERTAAFTTMLGDVSYYFCSEHCRVSFDNNPAPYLSLAGDPHWRPARRRA